MGAHVTNRRTIPSTFPCHAQLIASLNSWIGKLYSDSPRGKGNKLHIKQLLAHNSGHSQSAEIHINNWRNKLSLNVSSHDSLLMGPFCKFQQNGWWWRSSGNVSSLYKVKLKINNVNSNNNISRLGMNLLILKTKFLKRKLLIKRRKSFERRILP